MSFEQMSFDFTARLCIVGHLAAFAKTRAKNKTGRSRGPFQNLMQS
jgi:hypothetical protein